MPPRWQPSLEDYIDIAAYLLGADRAAIAALPRLSLAESALHVPFASFSGTDAYPTLVEQAAPLLEHLAKNDPLAGRASRLGGRPRGGRSAPPRRSALRANRGAAMSCGPCAGLDDTMNESEGDRR